MPSSLKLKLKAESSSFHENRPLSRITSSSNSPLSRSLQQEPRIRRIANSEFADHLFVQPAAGQIFASAGAFGPPQAFLKKGTRPLLDFQQHRPQLGISGFGRAAEFHLGQRDAQLLRHRPNRLGESHVLDLLHEAEHVARTAAAKAVKELPRGMHRKRRRLLVMERTKPGIVLRPGFLQLDVVADDADDVRLLLDGFLEIGGFGHEWRTLRRNCGPEKG